MSLINENIPLYKKPVDIDVVILPDGICVNGTTHPMDVQQAKSASDIKGILGGVFEASDRSYFTSGSLSITNSSGFDSPFLPMSVLKQIRRTFYGDLDAAFEKELSVPFRMQKPEAVRSDILPPRVELGLWDNVVKTDKGLFMALSPVMFNEKEYLEKTDAFIRENPGLIVGLNNIAQVLWAKNHPDTRFFADVFLYTQNTQAFEELKAEIPGMIGSYELDRDTPFNYTGDTYTPPLFISRVCMRHNSLNLPCKGCSRDNTYHLEQNGKHYKAICRNCITVVTKD